MIGKGKSIAHTGASISYGWNQDKGAEIIHTQHLIGDNPQEITQEFRLVQEMNTRTKNNTLSFVLSPTIEDGKKLTNQELGKLAKNFISEMNLKEHQAVAFVHRDKQHTHIHLYANRIGFDGKTYKDSFIGKRSQLVAEKVAKDVGLTTAREVRQEKLLGMKSIRNEIKQIHDTVIAKDRPKDFDTYIKSMQKHDVKVIPFINKANKLQGFRFEYKGHNLKGSTVHRSLSGGKIALAISNNSTKGLAIGQGELVKLSGKAVAVSANFALTFTKNLIKKGIKRSLGTSIGI